MNKILMPALFLIIFVVVICIVRKCKIASPGKAIAAILVVPVTIFLLNYLFTIIAIVLQSVLRNQSMALQDGIVAGTSAVSIILQELLMLLGYLFLFKFICNPEKPIRKIFTTQPKLISILIFILVFLLGFMQFVEYIYLAYAIRIAGYQFGMTGNFLDSFSVSTNPVIMLITATLPCIRLLILGLEAYACSRQTHP